MKLYKPESALLVIDMLNDFIKEGGKLFIPDAERIIPAVRMRLDEARSSNVCVVYLTDAHLEDDSEFEVWPSHAISGEWGSEIIDELAPISGEYVIRKRRYSAFFGTDLDILLRERGVKNLYFTGVLTNICIYATAIDASMRGYRVIVFRDGVASLSEETDRFIFSQLTDVLQAELI